MNIRRGVMRLWIVGSAFFILAIAALHGPEIVGEFRAAEPPAETPKGTTEGWPDAILLVPYNCAEARGQAGKDYAQAEYLGHATTTCWYEMPKFRALYPEYNNEDDKTLGDKLYQKIPSPPDFDKLAREAHLQTGWSLIKEWIAIALAGPLATLILGMVLAWVMVGFRGVRDGA